MTPRTATLENLIGHKFKDIGLLERALTHRSWAYENLPSSDEQAIRDGQNESMEFLGDSILGAIIAERLFQAHPKATEGELTLMKHNLVSTATLARIAEEMELGKYFKVGRGEEKTGGRKKQALLANTLEAVIAAVFLDGGYAAARVFVTGIFADAMKAATPRNSIDHKTTLQELLQGEKRSAPSYRVIETVGPPHDRTFSVEVEWDSGKARGTGNSIKAAEMKAASEALAVLNNGASGETKPSK